jgi:hypothetical protein
MNMTGDPFYDTTALFIVYREMREELALLRQRARAGRSGVFTQRVQKGTHYVMRRLGIALMKFGGKLIYLGQNPVG